MHADAQAGRRRKLGSIDDVGHHDHVCWTYSDDDTFRDVLIRYVVTGLQAGQRVACFVREAALDGFVRDLRRAESAAAEAERSGALVLGAFESAYLPRGVFDPDHRIVDYELMAGRAIADGYDGLRVAGDVTAILTNDENLPRWATYELRADALVAQHGLVALCAYDVREMHGDGLALLSALHPAGFGHRASKTAFSLHATHTGALALGGELDFASAHVIDELAECAAACAVDPALDLGELSFVDAAGMRSVLKVARALADAHPSFEIRGARPAIRRVWDLLDCDRIAGVGLGAS